MRSYFLPLLLLAAPALGQSIQGTTVETLYSGGPKTIRGGMVTRAGTGNDGGIYDGFPVGTVGCWDLGSPRDTIRGGYDFVATSSQRFEVSTTVPCVASGTPQYPLSVVVWYARDDNSGIVEFRNSDGTEEMGIQTNTSNRLFLHTDDTIAAHEDLSLAGGTSAAWTCAIFVYASTTSRAVYSDTATAGTTSTASYTPSNITAFRIGFADGDHYDGRIAYVAVLPVDLSGAGAAAQRTAIFAGADPVLVAGYTYGSLTRQSDGAQGAVWKLDNDSGDDAGPNNLDLTASGSPTAQNHLIVVRDQSGGGFHVKATTAAPTYSTSIGNGQGGGVFASASSQFLMRDGTPPVTAAPFQMYAVAQANNITAGHVVFFIGDKDVTDDYWQLVFAGHQPNDPSRFVATDASVTTLDINNYVADTNYLLWGNEASSTSRTHERNGGSTVSDTTNLSPDNADRVAIGYSAHSTPASYVDGEIHRVLLLNVSATTDQSRIERFFSVSYGLGF